MRKLALVMLAGALTGLISMSAFAAGQPSSKVAVAGGDLTALSQANGASTGTTDSGDGKLTDDTGWVTVMATSIKVPNDKGLAFDVALQSAIITTTEAKSKGGAKSTSEAMGSINVRVRLTDEDDNETYASPSEDPTPVPVDDLGVTFSRRVQTLEATFQGICIDAEGTVETGDNWDECDFEVVKLILDTLTANAFNFYYGPTHSGVYKVDVQARAQASAQIFGTADLTAGEAIGEAFVGLGSTFIETVRLFDSGDYGTGVPELE